ncbi:MAG: right-handed parallel beta-helix repeat-containing protein [Clostridia bacterium]|nr:right-handed parallel beta-helix repeat-containing protein [Clostridia bacterium]
MINEFVITDFGAVGDGVTDCTKAIQAALDAAAECRGIVQIPVGEYAVGKLKMHGNSVSMHGAGGWGYRVEGSSKLVLNDPSADCLLDITGAFACTIQGVSFIGRNLGSGIHGIKICWEEYNGGGQEDSTTIDHCQIRQFSGDGVHFEHVWAFSVRHSMLAANAGAGLFVDGWDAFILDNEISGNRGGGIVGGACFSSMTCTGNRIEWNRAGGVIIPEGNVHNLTGNYFDRSFGPGLLLGANGGVKHLSATGNVFYRNGAYRDDYALADPLHSCHVYMKDCKGVVISGNTFRVGCDDNRKGYNSPDYGFVLDDCDACIVKDNAGYCGALKEIVLLKGDNSTCVISDNVASLGYII